MRDPDRGSSPLRVRRTAAAAAVALAALAAAVPAQQGEPVAGAFAEEIGVEVVNVDVVVSDRSGRRVLDLAPEEFELRVDGRPVPIRYFAAPRAGTAPAAAPAPATPEEPSAPAAEPPAYLVVYIDQAALTIGARNRAVRELREFLGRRGDNEQVAVAAFEERLHLLAPPSSDPNQIDAALDALLALPVAGAIASTQRSQLDNAVRGIGVDWGGDRGRQAQRRESEAMQLETEIRTWAEQELARQQRSIAALKQMVGILGALEGRKSVVLVTGGSTTEGAEATLALLTVQRFGPNRYPEPIEAKRRLRTAFEEMVRAAQDARVALYTISPEDATMMQNSAEMTSPGRDVTPMRRDPAIVDSAASVARMAGATGATMMQIGRGLDRRLDQVRSDLESAYSLGFETDAAAGSGDHRIEVRMLRSGLSARHRSSFRRRGAAELAEEALYAAATLGETTEALGLAFELGEPRPVAGRRGDRMVPVTLRVPYRELALLPAGDSWRGRLWLRVAIEGDLGALFVADGVEVPIEIPEQDREQALEAVWTYGADIRLRSDSRRVAVVLLDRTAGVFATAAAAVGGAPGESPGR